jgi:hypothetical protein
MEQEHVTSIGTKAPGPQALNGLQPAHDEQNDEDEYYQA